MATAATIYVKKTSGGSDFVYCDDIGVQYAGPAPTALQEGFEKGWGCWTSIFGIPKAATVNKHSGKYSYMLDEDKDCISYSLEDTSKVLEVWFYDDTKYGNIGAGAGHRERYGKRGHICRQRKVWKQVFV